MKNMKKWAFVVGLMGALVVSCGKYEEGPKFSLQSKKARITNTWKYTKQETNGVDVTPPASAFSATMVLNDDGSAAYTATAWGLPIEYTGTWAFSDDKTSLILTDATGSEAYEIIKLEKDELKIRQMDGVDKIDQTYTAQ
ncbi:MAG: lipocalin family protein [Flavobacteriales bacterium]